MIKDLRDNIILAFGSIAIVGMILWLFGGGVDFLKGAACVIAGMALAAVAAIQGILKAHREE